MQYASQTTQAPGTTMRIAALAARKAGDLGTAGAVYSIIHCLNRSMSVFTRDRVRWIRRGSYGAAYIVKIARWD
jgi:hypothetical protein